MPKFPGKSYPAERRERASPEREVHAEFEAIIRTFNLAAPLIASDPEVEIDGIRLGDFYMRQIRRSLTDPTFDGYIGHPSPSGALKQPTVELGNLALWSVLLPEAFWEKLTRDEQNAVARAMSAWAHGPTHSHNWRWFNVMMLTFLDLHGFPVDQDLMHDHLDHLLLHEGGGGWYRDMDFDFYTAHVFHLYGQVWANRYGRRKDPARAALVDGHYAAFVSRFPMLFGRDGSVLMQGRSIIYRSAASAGLLAGLLGGHPKAPLPGVARRIASASLRQFLSHPDFLRDGLPSLGFYGPFEPAVQGYSCSASPYWMFMPFVAFALSEQHPFWTAREDQGHWRQVKPQEVRSVHLPGPGWLVSNHGPTGAAEVRPGKIHDADPNVSRLTYNSAFPWEDDAVAGPSAAALTLKLTDPAVRWARPSYGDHVGRRDGVLYRQYVFRSGPRVPSIVDTAVIVIPGGEIHVDRWRKAIETELTLGHFGMPHVGAEPVVERRSVEGHEAVTLAIPGRRLAVTLYDGWDEVGVETHHGLNAEAETSSLPFLRRRERRAYGPVELLVSVLLHRTDDGRFDDGELQPIAALGPLRPGLPAAHAGLKLRLKSGAVHRIDFGSMDGASTRN